MSLYIKFWGVRGSLPATLAPQNWSLHFENLLRSFFAGGFREVNHIPQFIDQMGIPKIGGYGVATTCVELRTPKTQLIIDGGSGIKSLSDSIMSGTTGVSKGDFHIYMTHFHLDHIMGLPFFAPHFVPGNTIHYYSVDENLESTIRGLFKKPLFPVPFEALQAKIIFHKLEPRKPHMIGDMKITPYKLDHPDPCWGARIENGGKVYAHCVDTEGSRVTREELAEDLPLYQNVDIMFFDAQYTFPELAEKANWGHSAAQVGLDIGMREGVKRIFFAHHDPGADIHQIQNLRQQTNKYYTQCMNAANLRGEPHPGIEWDFVYEGFEITV